MKSITVKRTEEERAREEAKSETLNNVLLVAFFVLIMGSFIAYIIIGKVQ